MDQDRKVAMQDDRQRSLERQIEEKKQVVLANNGMHQREVSERFKAEDDYQNWLKIKKMQRMDQVKEYRQILETQMQLSAVKQETDRRTSMGGAAGSPLLGNRRAQGEGYGGLPQDSKTANGVASSPHIGLDQLDLSPTLKNQSMKGAALVQSLGLPLDDLYSTFDPFKRSSNRLNNKLSSSIQEAA